MDINSLLSPSETPYANLLTSGTPAHSSFNHAQRTSSANSKISSSAPLARVIQPPSSIPAHIRSPSQQPSHSSPLISPVATVPVGTHHPRPSSTQSIETLADLASMQNHQPIRSTPPLANRDSFESNKSSHHRPTLTSNPRASFDIAMVETPKEAIRGDFSGTSLSTLSQQRLAELAIHIQETPSTYEAHIEFIKILHKGFVDHIYPSSSPDARGDPRTYDLLTELRRAREAAHKLFSVGEDQWLDWLQDESILAKNAEERVDVVEKCRQAVEEEFGSSRLWSTYGDWVRHCYDWALDTSVEPASESDLEKLVGRELFYWDGVVQVWEQAVEETKHDMSQSQAVWEKYMQAKFTKLDDKMPSNLAKQAMELFQDRLQTPHGQWESTFQTFSGFVSANYSNEEYEEIMAATIQISTTGKTLWKHRESFESALLTATDSNDKYAEYQAFADYIEWEKAKQSKLKQRKSKARRPDFIAEFVQDGMLVHRLYQRAELRVSSVASIWEDHINFMISQRIPGVKAVLVRATKHCPWSGALWKQQLLSSELADVPFHAVEAIKHNATKTGMLEAAGIEEVLKVYDAWCGYLVRRTKRADVIEEDIDVAEMGIRTSMEAVQSLASNLDLGEDFDGSFRLQRKYIEYLKGQGRLDNARKQFDDAIPVHGKHYRFWLRFYEFEMQKSIHINSLQQNSRDGVCLNSSVPFAVAILKQGLAHQNLDYPEYLIEALINHCEDYEEAEELQSALVLVSRVQGKVNLRRQREAEDNQVAGKVQAEVVAADRTEAVASNLHIGKRKREDEVDGEADQNKRVRADEVRTPSVEPPQSAAEELKRDREHASVLVRNLPENMSESRVRQYFTNCGVIQSLKPLQDDDHSYIVEFKEVEEAQYALSRDGQELDGAILSVILNTGSTLYVTNYLPTADETMIRSLFNLYGDIISIRFPSLQGNKRRRFCYVEFKTPEHAQAALELDGREIESFAMTVKISNPSVRKQRDIAKKDGRTIFVGQLPFKATEDEIKAEFSKFGEIELMRMPRDTHMKNRNKGIAFITFKTPEYAEAAILMNDKFFQSRKIKVNIAEGGASYQSKPSGGQSKSPMPKTNSKTASPSPSIVNVEERRQRTIALADVPDTVNESRIHAISDKIGPVVKVMLRTNHQGALVEFKDAVDAGKAALELDGFEINPGRKIRVTTEKDMMSQQPETKVEKIGKPAKGPVSRPVKRPVQPGARKGGHLGQRSGILSKHAESDQGNGDSGVVGKKCNDDFRAMLNKS